MSDTRCKRADAYADGGAACASHDDEVAEKDSLECDSQDTDSAEAYDDVSTDAAGAVTDGDAAALELAEHNALARVFDDVRAQSADGRLVEPVRWEDLGLVPEHMTAEDFEMFVYEYLEDERAAHEAVEAQHDEASKAPDTYRSAACAVGVPPLIAGRAAHAAKDEGDPDCETAALPAPGAAVAALSAETDPSPVDDSSAAPVAASNSAPSVEDDRSPFAGLSIPEGYRLVELEGEWVLVPTDEDAPPVELSIDCQHIVSLVGAHSYYLYDNSLMTDAFAHWAFLAAEDDDVVTFVECVREDSRVYPRPMPAQSLKNDPFRMDDGRIACIWDEVRESGAYPDIQQVVASNGDVYYFSTEYLSSAYAQSLAEWDAVERYMNV